MNALADVTTPLPDPGTALLAMLGSLPSDDAVVLLQSGPQLAPPESASLTACRLQQAYQHLQAVVPLWTTCLQDPSAIDELIQAFAGHPWQALVQKLLPAWCDAVQRTPDCPLDVAIQHWQRLHDHFWQRLELPPVPVPALHPVVLPQRFSQADISFVWHQTLRQFAERVGRIAAICFQHTGVAQPGQRIAIKQDHGATLYRYPAEPSSPPILLVYAWINHPDVLDLAPTQSLIAALQAQGLAVWLLDWSLAGGHAISLEHYVFQHLDRAIARVVADSGQPKISLLGICQGGTLALSYAACKPQHIRSLSLAATPVDFQTAADRLSALAQGTNAEQLRTVAVQTPGLLNLAFLQLKPFSLRIGKFLHLLAQNPNVDGITAFLRMEHWLISGPLLSGPALADYLARYYQGNGLCTNTLRLADSSVTLKQLKVPVQVLVADQDHIVPPASSLVLQGRTGGVVTTEHFATGHIGLLVGRVRQNVAASVAQFVQQQIAIECRSPEHST